MSYAVRPPIEATVMGIEGKIKYFETDTKCIIRQKVTKVAKSVANSKCCSSKEMKLMEQLKKGYILLKSRSKLTCWYEQKRI